MLKIPFSKVECNGNELKYVAEVLDSGWLTTASKTFAFEKQFAEMIGCKYACAVNSCTAALHLGLEALGVGAGGKVFVPSMTFTASAEVVRYLNADPIFLDIEYGSNLITPEILQKAIIAHPDVKYLIVVHYGGQSAQMAKDSSTGINDMCRTHGIKILEDAAHAFPSRLGGRMVGSFGNVACFSFYANKTITTGEGGMLTTDDEGIWARVKTMRLHGINRDIWNRYTSNKPNWEYDVVAPGFKYNLPDVSAAIGLAQLERATAMRDERQRCVELYQEQLGQIECIDLPLCHCTKEEHSWHLFHVVLKENSPITRNTLIDRLAEMGIGTSVHYKPLHRMQYYRERYGLTPVDFPHTERMWNGCVSLPIYPSLSNQEIRFVCESLRSLLSA